MRSLDDYSPAARIAIVLAGIFLGQAVLYGPSIIGAKILLPLDMLATQGIYLPRTPEFEGITPNDVATSDLVLYLEPERRFVNSELRAGRLPLWSPYRFGGSPLYPFGVSPLWIIAYLFESPVVHAWVQLLVSLTAGFGAYAFNRHVLKTSFWPSTITAWCYPLTGSYILWQGQWLPAVMCWLPWMLLAVHRVVQKPLGFAAPCLCAMTTMLLTSGAQDIAGQVLLTSGLFACWCLFNEFGIRRPFWPALCASAILAFAWGLGIAGSAWLMLPMNEYVHTGARMIARSHGSEERPPFGIAALPQVVLPDIYGSSQRGSFRIAADALSESSAQAYAGLIATLLAAPLAFFSRRHLPIAIAMGLLALFGLSWNLNIPGIVQILRLPGLNMMSHSRLGFVTAFAVLSLATIGLDTLLRGQPAAHRAWYLLPTLPLTLILAWGVYRSVVPPEPIATQLSAALNRGESIARLGTQADVVAIQHHYAIASMAVATFALVGMACWLWIMLSGHHLNVLVAALAVGLVGEMLWFGYGRAAQCDWSLYYPRIPLLEQLAKREPGRLIGVAALPANLSQMAGLADIRGYDGVDPQRMIELLTPIMHPFSPHHPHAQLEYMSPTPVIGLPTGGCKLSPVLDMLNVRYVIFRGSPQAGVSGAIVDRDYFAMVNNNALPRIFVPRSVEFVPDDQIRVKRLTAADFDPRATAFVETAISLPNQCKGDATIVEETPTHAAISLQMETAGMVVLSDLWDVGWHAYLDGTEVAILRANHAVRGVVVPASARSLEFRFEPTSMLVGARISGSAFLVWLVWVGATPSSRLRRQSWRIVPARQASEIAPETASVI